MKRCDNCGWMNQDHLDRCEKCGNVLGLSEEEQQQQEQNREEKPQPEAPAKASKYSATMLNASRLADTLAEGNSSDCPKCGYPLSGKPEKCPNCGARLVNTTVKDTPASPAPASPYSATVRDVSAARAVAAPAPQAAGTPSGKSIKGTVRDFFGHSSSRKPDPAPAAPAASAATHGQVYRLVPVGNASYPVIYVSEGDIITIGDRRYKFEK